jgi:RecA/RadA recombinase
MSSVKTNEKWRAVETALTQIERQFGKGSIMRLGERPEQAIAVIPTGSLAVDAALGVGGIPRGRVVEIFGPESSGKTTLSLQIIAQAQKTGGLAAFIDAEHALDADYAKKLGVDTDNLLVSQPDNGEQALEIAEMLIRSGAIDVIVVDSVAALVPKAEIEGEMGEAQMGLQARLMSQALRKLTAIVSKSRTSLIFINQIREKIGVMFGNPETTTGGPRSEVLLVDPHRHPPHRLPEGRRDGRRLADEGQGRQEQGRLAVPAGGVRHQLRRGHLAHRRADRHGHRGQDRREVGRVALVRRPAHRPGPRELEAVPEGEPGARRRDRAQAAPEPRPRADRARARRAAGAGAATATPSAESRSRARRRRSGGNPCCHPERSEGPL